MKRANKIRLLMSVQWTLLGSLLISLVFTRPIMRFRGQNLICTGLIVAGLTTALLAIVEYRKVNRDTSVRVVPTPHEQAKLVSTGIYSVVRHPIYLGSLLIAVGIGIWYANFPTTIIVVLMAVFFQVKSRFEESLLMERYPEYASYRKSTGRIFPRLMRSPQRISR